jgi:hypothetical protein
MEETYETFFSLDISVWEKLKILIRYVSVRLSDLLFHVQFDGNNVNYIAVVMAQRHSQFYCITFNNPLHVATNLKSVKTEL